MVKDIVGLTGCPKSGGGFKIEVIEEGRDLSISPGRIYVDGLLGELETSKTYLNQPDYPNPPKICPEESRTDLVYLDVWTRHITSIEDPNLLESALGGPDTCTRVKTIWQVKVLEDVGRISCADEIRNFPPSRSGARLSTEAFSEQDSNQVNGVTNGYTGLENHLYRVEIHDGGEVGQATFKWSRYNGSRAFGVEYLTVPTTLKIHSLGNVGCTLKPGDWVEILGDETELKELPGNFAKISDINPTNQEVTLDRDITFQRNENHLKIRCWDGQSGLKTVAIGLVELEEGIRVKFSGKNFKNGDYWVFATRTNDGSLEPLNEAPPMGISHHCCKLALITWHKRKPVQVQDCRIIFLPLTELLSQRHILQRIEPVKGRSRIVNG